MRGRLSPLGVGRVDEPATGSSAPYVRQARRGTAVTHHLGGDAGAAVAVVAGNDDARDILFLNLLSAEE